MRLSNELLMDSLQVSKLILPGNIYLGPFEKSLRKTNVEIILRSPVIIWPAGWLIYCESEQLSRCFSLSNSDS